MATPNSEGIPLDEIIRPTPPPTPVRTASTPGDAIVQIASESRVNSWSQRQHSDLHARLDRLELLLKNPRNDILRALSQDYEQLKRRPVDPNFLKDLLFLEVLHSPLLASVGVVELATDDQTTFRACLDRIRTLVMRADPGNLRICIIYCQIPPSIASKLYHPGSKMLVSSSRMQQKYRAPWLSMLLVLADQWNLPESLVDRCLRLADSELPRLIPFCKNLVTRDCQSPLLLNSEKWEVVELHWHAGVPRYKDDYMSYSWLGDYKLYVWQPQNDIDIFPPQRAIILISSHSDSIRDVLILLRPSLTVQGRPISYYKYTHPENLITSEPGGNQIKVGRIMSYIISIYNTILSDSKECAKSLLNEIAVLRLEGRRHPTVGKVNFVLHLDDIRQSAMLGLRDAIVQLPILLSNDEGLSGEIESSQDKVFKELVQKIQDGSKALEEEFEALGQQLDELRAMLREQIELSQIGRTALLTILAAIYLPFSLVAGIFGMNLTVPLWNNESGNTSSPSPSTTATIVKGLYFDSIVKSPLSYSGEYNQGLKASASALPAAFSTDKVASLPVATSDPGFSQSQTDQIVAAITSAADGNYSWNFKSFWYIAVIVTALTILLPMVAGWVFRGIIRFSYQHANYWVMVLFLTVLGAIITANFFLNPVVFVAIFGGLQAVVALWNLAQAFQSRRTKKRWISYSVFLVFFVAIDLSTSTYRRPTDYKKVIEYNPNPLGLTGFIPPVFLFTIWIQPIYPNLTTKFLLDLDRMITNWQLVLAYRKHRTLAMGIGLLLSAGFNVLWSFFGPGYTYLLPTAVGFGLYGLDQLWSALGWTSKFIWFGYLSVLGLSIWLWMATAVYLVGPVALFPSLYLLWGKAIIAWKRKRSNE